MKKGGTGGGNTKTGLIYEAKVDLATFLNKQTDYTVKDGYVFYNKKLIARLFKKHKLYSYLEENGINWEKHLSKKLLPDDCIYVIINNTVFIIEVKHQQTSGSVDEKLQTCDFKKKQYMKLFSELNYKLEYIYILDDWFKKPQYKDVRDYIISVGCRYYYNYIPLQELGLPVPKKK
ncbi:MAG: hypothetical protein IJP72_02750 [Bacteroidales bacterium]|nr:hypothetical protein [Bacteroidales bacterium]